MNTYSCDEVFRLEYERVGDYLQAYNNLSKECKGLLGYDIRPILSKSKAFKRYRKLVQEITEQNCAGIPNLSNRGFTNHNIDHIVPIYLGFKLGILPTYIGSKENLQLIPFLANMSKGVSITAKAQMLLNEWGIPY